MIKFYNPASLLIGSIRHFHHCNKCVLKKFKGWIPYFGSWFKMVYSKAALLLCVWSINKANTMEGNTGCVELLAQSLRTLLLDTESRKMDGFFFSPILHCHARGVTITSNPLQLDSWELQPYSMVSIPECQKAVQLDCGWSFVFVSPSRIWGGT